MVNAMSQPSQKLQQQQPKTGMSHSTKQTGQQRQYAMAPSGPLTDVLTLQDGAGNRATSQIMRSSHANLGLVQAKLIIDQPGDILEQEADRIAQVVMQRPVVQNDGGVGIAAPVQQPLKSLALQPSYGTGLGDITPGRVDTLPSGTARGLVSEESHELGIYIQGLRGHGQPLPEPIRTFFETRFGYSFRQVRVHQDTQAAHAAGAVQARAFTVGSNIVFGTGRYAPETSEGRRLLAHELVHVIQQSSSNSNGSQPATRTKELSLRSVQDNRLSTKTAPLIQRQTENKHHGPFGTIDKLLSILIPVIEKIPLDEFGPFAELVRSGLVGFIKRMAREGAMKLYTIASNAYRIINREYLWGFLIGFLKGFFWDGLLGILALIVAVIEGVVDTIKSTLETARMGREIGEWLKTNASILSQKLVHIYISIRENYSAIRKDITSMITSGSDRPRLNDIMKTVLEKAKNYVQMVGEKIASKLVEAFSNKKTVQKIGRTLGELAGRPTGFAVYIAISSAISFGALGAIGLAAKVTRWILPKVAKGVGGLIPIGRSLISWVRTTYQTLRGWIQTLSEVKAFKTLAAKVKEMFSTLQEFAEGLALPRPAAGVSGGGTMPVPPSTLTSAPMGMKAGPKSLTGSKTPAPSMGKPGQTLPKATAPKVFPEATSPMAEYLARGGKIKHLEPGGQLESTTAEHLEDVLKGSTGESIVSQDNVLAALLRRQGTLVQGDVYRLLNSLRKGDPKLRRALFTEKDWRALQEVLGIEVPWRKGKGPDIHILDHKNGLIHVLDITRRAGRSSHIGPKLLQMQALRERLKGTRWKVRESLLEPEWVGKKAPAVAQEIVDLVRKLAGE